jgi:hypothetical protein
MLLLFIKAVFAHWIATVGILLTLTPFVPQAAQKWIETRMNKQFSPKHLWIVGTILLAFAFYQAWVDEHTNAEQLISEKLQIVEEREFWKSQSYEKDGAIRKRDELLEANIGALSSTQSAFAQLSNKVLDITRPEQLLVQVKQNEISTIALGEKKLWIISLVSNKSFSPIRGTVSCANPFEEQGTPVVTGESATLALNAGAISDRAVRLGIVSPALNPDTPLLIIVMAPENPGLGKCTFTRG